MANLFSIFRLPQHNTTISREIVAGLTTFTTMSYIIVVNPAHSRMLFASHGPMKGESVTLTSFM